jgi:hypothetical protein
MNENNLEILAQLLDKLPQDGFSMLDYAQDEDEESINPYAHDCMTVGCAVGHGPAAGLPVHRSDKDWTLYSERVFGLKPWGDTEFSWDWCFHQGWLYIDNTPAGASKRIRHLIQHGLPQDALEQRRGRAPYVYGV